MITERTKSVRIVLEIEEQSSFWTEKTAEKLMAQLQDSETIQEFNPHVERVMEFVCGFCHGVAAKKELLTDAGLPVCCDKAQREFIKEHEQIFTDPENQPNQFGIGLCECGNLYDQKEPTLAVAKMCETCLGDAQPNAGELARDCRSESHRIESQSVDEINKVRP